MEPITHLQQISVLEKRIHELESRLQSANKVDTRPLNPKAELIFDVFGLNEKQADELLNIVKYWMFRHNGPEVLTLISSAPLPEREKLYMMAMFCKASNPPPNDPRVVVMPMPNGGR